MEIRISREKKEEKIRISGIAIYMDTKFTFTLFQAPASKPKYAYLVRANVISPATNKILQAGGQKRKAYKSKQNKIIKNNDAILETLEPSDSSCSAIHKATEKAKANLDALKAGRSIEALNATAEKYICDSTDKTIKAMVEFLCKKLYSDYQADIHAGLKQENRTGSLCARVAYDIHINVFLLTQPKVTAATLATKMNTIKKFCTLINDTPINEITEKDIEKVLPDMGKNRFSKLKLVEKFFDYCGEMGVYSVVNPITKYLNHHRPLGKKVRKPGARRYPNSPSYLSEDVELRLHEILKEQLGEPLALAIPLAKGFRMPISQILSIQWKSVVFQPDGTVNIRHIKETSSATQIYTRPPTAETADFLIETYAMLKKVEKRSKKELENTYLVPIVGSDKEKKAALTKYFRAVLKEAGVESQDFAIAVDPNQPKAEGGAGYALLCKHFDYVLAHRCGVNLDSGVGHFMRGMRINDTTTDSYRSLTDCGGNHYLQIVMRRDRWFFQRGMSAESGGVIETEMEDGGYHYTMEPCSQLPINSVITTKGILISAGTPVKMSNTLGLEGNVLFYPVGDEKARNRAIENQQTLY